MKKLIDLKESKPYVLNRFNFHIIDLFFVFEVNDKRISMPMMYDQVTFRIIKLYNIVLDFLHTQFREYEDCKAMYQTIITEYFLFILRVIVKEEKKNTRWSISQNRQFFFLLFYTLSHQRL